MTVPFNDIKIDPKLLKTKLIKEIDNIDIDNIIKKIVIKEINNILNLNHFWYEVTGKNICAYKYQFSKKKAGEICGKPIYSKHKDEIYGNFLCSRHLKTHKVERPRKLKNDEINCKAITINNTKCLNSAKLDGYCSQHYKTINKTNINEIHKLIKLKKIEKNNKIINKSKNIGNLEKVTYKNKLENNKLQEKVENKYKINNIINSTIKSTNDSNTNKMKRKNKNYNSMINKKIKNNNIINSTNNLRDVYYYKFTLPSQAPLPPINNNYNTPDFSHKNNIFNKKGLFNPFFI